MNNNKIFVVPEQTQKGFARFLVFLSHMMLSGIVTMLFIQGGNNIGSGGIIFMLCMLFMQNVGRN